MFSKAQPIYPLGKGEEMNSYAVFSAILTGNGARSIRVSAASFYRLSVNGKFVAFGPARSAKGYARVDELSLAGLLGDGENRIVIEVTNHHVRSLSSICRKGFLCAEVLDGGGIPLAWTGRDFEVFLSGRKVQCVERYSAQRQFGEVWDERPGAVDLVPSEYETVEGIAFLPRRAPYPDYHAVLRRSAAQRGVFSEDAEGDHPVNRYSYLPPDRYAEENISFFPYRWFNRQILRATGKETSLPVTLRAGEYLTFDFGQIETGFLTFDFEASEECDLVAAYSEYCRGETFEFSNINCQNVIEYLLPSGKRVEEQSFEPYTARFVVFAVKRGCVTLHSAGIRTYEHPTDGVRLTPVGDALADSIRAAALRTFCHNAVDIFTDCPSRERAGWFCDSYFTGKSEFAFFGNNRVEEDFLENMALYVPDGAFPDGILPMSYPSDPHPGKGGKIEFIPQWNMWMILELEDAILRRAVGLDPSLFRDKVFAFLDFLKANENAEGLLERLPGWNFVEWTEANDWVDDVSYPTNFLYARVLDAVDALYGRPELALKAKKVRETAVSLSFDGEFFRDHAKRGENGVLVNEPHVSEVCQYYALLFGGVDPKDPKYRALLEAVRNGFAGVENRGFPFVHINAFIGLYLRMDVLLSLREYRVLIGDLGEFFGGMVEKTGTLWEYRQYKGSYDHGFASYAAIAIGKAFEGLKQQ